MPEERDQLFEKALARQLRADALGESLCLEPETLAAYHERTLSPEELSAAKSHIVSCGRCQEVLAQLEATQEINAIRSQLEPALTTAGSAPSRAIEFQDEAALIGAPAAVALPAGPQKVTQISSKKLSAIRWAAPAGAIAAGLLLLIGVREFRKPGAKSVAEPVQVAENRPETPRSEDDSTALKDLEKQKSDLQVRKDLEQLQTKVPAAPPASRDEKKSSTAANMPAFAKSQNLRQYAPARSGMTRALGPSAAASQAQAADKIQSAAPGLVGGASQSVEVAPQPPALDANKQAQVQAPNDKAAVAGLVAGAPASAPAPPAPAPARAKGQSPTGAGQGAGQAAADTQLMVTAQAPMEASSYKGAANKIGLDIRIAAPGGKKIWSIGPNGQILFSKDAGRSWLAQPSGVYTNLTAGSAPSDKVCWIAGANGTLLRTTDGGQHWQIVQTPISGDLGGVHAADAQHASIWDAPNHVSYETGDGGATWKQIANE